MRLRSSILSFLALALMLTSGCATALSKDRSSDERRLPMQLKTASGVATDDFQLHDSMLFEASDLLPRTAYKVQVTREDGKVMSESVLSTDRYGRIPETIIWYDLGVRYCPKALSHRELALPALKRDIEDLALTNKAYALNIIKDEKIVRKMDFRVSEMLKRPQIYATDSRGCPKSGFLIGEEDVWVEGRNFPTVSLIKLWAVPDNTEWKDADSLKDVTKQYGSEPPLFELEGEATSFRRLLWPKNLTSIGSYDIVAETISYPFGAYHPSSTAKVLDVVSNLKQSGFVIQRRQGVKEPLEMKLVGTKQSPLTYRSTFLTSENVYVGVDPTVQPSFMGKTADIYIVNDRTDAGWTVNTALPDPDASGNVESITVQFVCGNCWATLAWPAPLSPGKYDVVLDFDQDHKYTSGVDLINSLDPIGFTVSEIRVDSISFNYGGSNAVTIYDNKNQTVVSPPEFSSGANVVKPAAWVKGGSHTVQITFKADPNVTSAQIWAENGLGGLNSSSSPVTVNFTNGTGQGTFTVNNPPTSIGKHIFAWDWKYKNVNGAVTPAQDMGSTGQHILYATYSPPKAPMAVPWVEALEYAATWANGETNEAEVVSKIVNGIYNSAMVYDGGGHHTTGMGTFNLTGVFNELRTPGFTVYMDCRDCANLLHVLTNALGFSHQYLRIPGYFDFKPILPMGQPACNPGGWNYHQVGWCGSQVADASAKLTCNTSAICDISANAYISLLTDTPGITAGATGVCAPY